VVVLDKIINICGLFPKDMLVLLFCALGFGAGGVIGALGANNWSTDIINQIPSSLQQFVSLLIETRDALAATAVRLIMNI